MRPTLLLIISLTLVGATLISAATTKQTGDRLSAAKKAPREGDLINARSDQSASKAAPSETSPGNQNDASSASSSSSSAAAPAGKTDKKQDEAASSSAQTDAFQSSDEYVHIKPEEITVNDQNKELMMGETAVALDPQQPQTDVAEHKSAADDELSAHLAQPDTIGSLESAYRPYASLAPPPASPRAALVGGPRPAAGYQGQKPPQGQAAYPRPMQPYAPARASPRPHGAPLKAGLRMPPSYITLKGKLTGINSLISQYPHPAPGYPHQGPRHLPRGAAAGYAAFRDFVRAHASKYKQPNGAPQYGPPLAAGPPAAQGPSSYEAPPVVSHEEPPKVASYAGQSGAPAMASGGYKAPRAIVQKTKVTMAQAYIPHLAPASSPAAPGGGYGGQQQQLQYTNPMLAKLYGNRAPQGIGRPEYNKDYGMVIHYPQATVYTEPMTVEQLYKLTGGGISQVIEQLQYNLAHGHRDESNIIRPYNKHHIGDGITIHAKEFHAPSKGGHYVPTTAAVISTGNSYGEAGQEQQGYGAQEQRGYRGPEQQQHGGKQYEQLGSGYERVKQAVAAGSQESYNNKPSGGQQAEYQPAQQPQQPAGYERPTSNRYPSNGEPLTAITNLIGSELEALYKANAALTKQVEPEIHAQLQAFAKSPASKQPLRYSNLHQRSPMGAHGPAHPRGRGPRKGPHGGHRQPYQGPRPHGADHPHRPMPGRQPGGHGPRPNGGAYQQQHQYHQRGRGSQQAYQAAEQALSQQVAQLLHDFQSDDDQYNSKAQPYHPTSQGYPQKVMQKYQQNRQPQQQQQQHQQPAYGQQDGLEIPQGPNDQIGEIADLIEALKGSLELHKPEPQEGNSYNKQVASGKLNEDVRYLSSALGQAPSYAMQVPVAGEQQEQSGYEAKKNPQETGAYQQQATGGQPGSYQQAAEAAASGYKSQQQQAGSYEAQQQLPSYASPQANGQYGQQSGDYQTGGGQRQPEYQPQQISHSEYSTAVQHVVNQVASGYQAAPSPANVASSGYSQQSQQQQPAPERTGAYATNEQPPVSVINHLVPVTGIAAAPASGAYSSHEAPAAAIQPTNQIVPTDSQYQQAQSLSSFVDSLPTEYQELLRQPALLSGNSSVPHLAALAQETSSLPYGGQPIAQNTAQQPQEGQQQHQQQQQLESYGGQQQQQQQTSDLHQAYQQASSAAGQQAQSLHSKQQQYSTVKK